MNGCRSLNEQLSPRSSVRSGLQPLCECSLCNCWFRALSTTLPCRHRRENSSARQFPQGSRSSAPAVVRVPRRTRQLREANRLCLDFHGQFSRSLKGRRDCLPAEDQTRIRQTDLQENNVCC